MKRILSLILACVLLACSLASCTRKMTTLPEGMSGTEAVKLMLAGQRLDSSLLQDVGSIFNKGKRDFLGLAEKATESYNQLLRGNSLSVGSFSNALEYKEYNNSYDYFLNRTKIITQRAESAADLIDDVKKNVRVVNTWVEKKDEQYYLQVGENHELLIRNLLEHDQIDICLRYKNEAGKDVYELYCKSPYAVIRIKYIPGEFYEEHEEMIGQDGAAIFVADSSRGYWQVLTSTTHSSTAIDVASFYLMRDNVNAECNFILEEGRVSRVTFMSGDNKTQIMELAYCKEYGYTESGYRGEITLYLNSFDGVKDYAVDGSVKLKNGKTIKNGDTYANGNLSVLGIIDSEHAGNNRLGSLTLVCQSNEMAQMLAHIKTFLSEVGLTCRRDFDLVAAGAENTAQALGGLVSYYRWNGFAINVPAEASKAMSYSGDRIAELAKYYEDVKDAPVVKFSRGAAYELLIPFSPVLGTTNASAEYKDEVITIPGIGLQANDTMLFVKDEPYKIGLAFRSAVGELIHLEFDNDQTFPYSGAGPLEAHAENLTLSIPALAPGEYTLVAYIATSEAVRSTDCLPVSFAPFETATIKQDHVAMTVSHTDGALRVTSVGADDVYFQAEAGKTYTAASLYEALAVQAYTYGNPVAGSLEKYDLASSAYLPCKDTGNLGAGEYRIAFTLENTTHYVYTALKAAQ